MKVLVTGGTGGVGRFVVEDLLARGHHVTVAGRTPPRDGFFSGVTAFQPFSLDPDALRTPLPDDCDALVHAAFHHVPGRYRGGEGNDPVEFLRLNRDGSIALFEAARTAGIRRCVFLSSRAVYGAQPTGTAACETTPPRPDTLYGQAKCAAEQALSALSDAAFCGVSLRATGVYGPAGPGRHHKWQGLFEAFAAGWPIAPRCATEVHGLDLARAVTLVLSRPRMELLPVYNVSDIMVERREILSIFARETGIAHALPQAEGNGGFITMTTDRLEGLGWQPGGRRLLEATVVRLARAFSEKQR